jgi:hypothetical protein
VNARKNAHESLKKHVKLNSANGSWLCSGQHWRCSGPGSCGLTGADIAAAHMQQ